MVIGSLVSLIEGYDNYHQDNNHIHFSQTKDGDYKGRSIGVNPETNKIEYNRFRVTKDAADLIQNSPRYDSSMNGIRKIVRVGNQLNPTKEQIEQNTHPVVQKLDELRKKHKGEGYLPVDKVGATLRPTKPTTYVGVEPSLTKKKLYVY